MLHVCVNLRQYLIAGVGQSTDTRDREKEFSRRSPIPTEELMEVLTTTTTGVEDVLGGLSPSSLLTTRQIQGSDQTVLTALLGSISHFHGHAEKIIYIARSRLGDAYKFGDSPPQQRPEVSSVGSVTARDSGRSVVGPIMVIHYVVDMERAKWFYRQAFNVTASFESDGWTTLDFGGIWLALHGSPKDEDGLSEWRVPRAGLIFQVNDFQQVAADAERIGGRLKEVREATDHSPQVNVFEDSEGNTFEMSPRE